MPEFPTGAGRPSLRLFEGTAAREHRTDLSHQTAQMRRARRGDAERHLRRASGNDDVARLYQSKTSATPSPRSAT
jgi:hypothetical protein